MKVVKIETLLSCGDFSGSDIWQAIRNQIVADIESMEWPKGAGRFLVYPQSGKKRGEGNGVKPIKNGLMAKLKKWEWKLEEPMDIATVKKPGKLDAVIYTELGPVALEWETGNVSSSHRALNKMALGLQKGALVGGILVVPTRNFYQYLTDRVGNFRELAPYFDLWKSIPCENGVLEVIAIEHDGTSEDAPRIEKGTDGRALV